MKPNKNIFKILCLVMFLLVINEKSFAYTKFNMGYYGDDYFYKYEYKITINEGLLNNLVKVNGFIKQNTINKSKLNKYIKENNNILNIQRILNNKSKDKNYFYGFNLGLRLYDFYVSDSENNIYLYFNYYNSIEYYEFLDLTFLNDIYERYGIGLKYNIFSSNISTTTFFLDYDKTKEKIKEILSLGLENSYNISDSLSITLGYNYSKDYNKIKNKNLLLRFFDSKIIINGNISSILMNTSHNIKLNSSIKFDEYITFNIGANYTINKNYDNILGFNFMLEF